MNPNNIPLTTVIDDCDAGSRCDRYLASLYPQFSRMQLQRWLETGAVTVNGKSVKPAYKLQEGDSIQILPPPMVKSGLVAEAIPLDILYEDSDLIVINKAAGMVVHPGAGQRTGTLVHALLSHCDDLQGVGDEERPGIVHRLDKGTSGVLVVAKSDQIFRALQAQFQARTVVKEYLACAHGVMPARAGLWDQAIGRHPVQRQKMAVRDRGRACLTRWEVVDKFDGFATWLHLFLHTGRTHQIRVHCAAAGHPLVGDETYGGAKAKVGPPAWREAAAAFTRPALHAFRLQLIHPRTQQPMAWTAPVPSDLENLLQDAQSCVV